MSDSGHSRILSAEDEYGLIGRENELSEIVSHTAGASGSALLVLSAPGAGVSAVLRTAYDRIFREGGDLVPVYFEFRPSDRSARKASERFLHEFLSQVVAFLRGEPRILTSHPDVLELEEMAPAADREWIRRLIAACGTDTGINPDGSFIAKAFGAPQRASVQGLRCFVMLDGLDRAARLEGGEGLAERAAQVLEGGDSPFVLAGRRRSLQRILNSGGLKTYGAKQMEVEPLGFDAAGLLVQYLAERQGVSVTEQSRDLIATVLGRRPALIEALIEEAATEGKDLKGFRDVLRTYAGSLFDGRVGGYFESVLNAAGDVRTLLELFSAAHSGRENTVDLSLWANALGGGGSAQRGLGILESEELISVGAGGVHPVADDVFEDFVSSRHSLQVLRSPYERVLSEYLANLLKRAAGVMTGVYRSFGATGVGNILAMFDCQEIPLALMDYGIYSENYKGEPIEKLLSEMRGDLEKVKLPQVFLTDPASAFYEPIGELIEDDRAAIAFAFEHAEYEDDNEVVWLAAEIDSKLEATEELASFWCDRMEMVAIANDIARFRIWLVAPEGFSPAAVEVLHQRHAIGSSRAQARMLASYLSSGELNGGKPPAENFEIVVPMGEDTELIAAHAIEDIARRKGFSANQINQIKTALVEACINASEHSLSPDRKIRIGVAADGDVLRLTVSNRGLRFADTRETSAAGEQRRGWGIKLMRSLMDEIRFERVDDGTRIVMVKYSSDPAA